MKLDPDTNRRAGVVEEREMGVVDTVPKIADEPRFFAVVSNNRLNILGGQREDIVAPKVGRKRRGKFGT